MMLLAFSLLLLTNRGLQAESISAMLSRATDYLAQKDSISAINTYNSIIQHDPHHIPAYFGRSMAQLIQGNAYGALFDLERVITMDPKFQQGFLDHAPLNATARKGRSECYTQQRKYDLAIADAMRLVNLQSNDSTEHQRLGLLYFLNGQVDQALLQSRQCLILNQDHKECRQLYNSSNDNLAITYCTKAIKLTDNDAELYSNRANAHLSLSQFEEAIDDYKSALKLDSTNKEARDGIERAEMLFKKSQKKDYYKILGVKRNAKKEEIMRAYRNLARKWHPDKHKGEAKKYAEKVFIDLTQAKEVLTNDGQLFFHVN